ncbi:MAG: response regulator [Bacteroidota bacterium]|nr:response regulator [Bacteroidota bacterium]
MNILLIEDNIGDVYLIQASLDEMGLEYRLSTVHNGEIAIAYIRHCEELMVPDLILLDINMPGKSGFDVLTELKSSDSLKDIPVIVITSSMSDEQREKARKLGAVGFVSKPPRYPEYSERIKSLLSNYMN